MPEPLDKPVERLHICKILLCGWHHGIPSLCLIRLVGVVPPGWERLVGSECCMRAFYDYNSSCIRIITKCAGVSSLAKNRPVIPSDTIWSPTYIRQDRVEESFGPSTKDELKTLVPGLFLSGCEFPRLYKQGRRE